jgi:hypothetical protein
VGMRVLEGGLGRRSDEPQSGHLVMKGDKVEIVVDAGDGTKTYEVEASRAGRRVEVVSRRGLIEVVELTRGGTPVRTARFMASRVIALVEHPASRTRGTGRGQAGSAGAAG